MFHTLPAPSSEKTREFERKPNRRRIADTCESDPDDSDRRDPKQIRSLLAFTLILIANHFRPLECDQAAAHHFIKHRQKCIYLFLRVHNFDYNWKIHGQAKNFRSVQVT